MDNLTFSLRKLCQRNRDGSHATQADRRHSLALMARQLREMGFLQLDAKSLKGKHVEALLERWQTENLAVGTIKNRLSHLRWWAEKIGKAGILPADNALLGVPQRRYVTNISKARELGDALGRITDEHVGMSLRLQAAFGLRRGEAIKFRPAYANRGDHIVLKASWTKGKRGRSIPITTATQREVLQAAHKLAGAGSLIPADKRYIDQRNLYDGQCKAAGLNQMHGLRHHYAQQRYEALTGWKSPVAGGPSGKALTPSQRKQDAQARQIISRELGHEQMQITAVYLGR